MALEMKYFVLEPRSKYKHDAYAAASRMAIRQYAEGIQNVDPKLAEELRAWAEIERERDEGM